MEAAADDLLAADLAELVRERVPHRAPTMGTVAKVSYTHADMIDFLIANPGISQGALATRYGYSQGWISNVMASDAWKTMLHARRAELVDPVLHASLVERFEGMAKQSLERLQERLAAPQVSDGTILKALELGAKALGVGGNAPPPPPPSADHLAVLAQRMLALQSQVRQGVLPYVETIESSPVPAHAG